MQNIGVILIDMFFNILGYDLEEYLIPSVQKGKFIMSTKEISKRNMLSNSMLKPKHRYAEAWLEHAVELYRPIFREGGYEIPPVLLSVGFADSGYKPNRKNNTIAICYSRVFSPDGINQIIITPLRTEPLDLLWLIGHELIHAVDDCEHGHGPAFDKIAHHIGHWPNKRASIRDLLVFDEKMAVLAKDLGRYPRSPFHFA